MQHVACKCNAPGRALDWRGGSANINGGNGLDSLCYSISIVTITFPPARDSNNGPTCDH